MPFNMASGTIKRNDVQNISPDLISKVTFGTGVGIDRILAMTVWGNPTIEGYERLQVVFNRNGSIVMYGYKNGSWETFATNT